METNMVQQFAGKLGLTDEGQIIDKTYELMRLLKIKSGAASLSVSSCVMLCIDMATSLYGHSFDLEVALKLSGLKKPAYLNHRRIVEKILDINKPIGVNEICVQLGITEIQRECQMLLDAYASSPENSLRNIDINHPQYPAMVVYQLAKLKGIKIKKTKLVTYSHLKPQQWNILEKSWEKWTESNPKTVQQFHMGGSKKNDKTAINLPRENNNSPGKVILRTEIEPEDDFETWRERVLRKALADLERIQNTKAM